MNGRGQRKRYALDLHVLKSEPIISELRIPVRSIRLILCLRGVMALRGEPPARGAKWEGIGQGAERRS
jgi:hypothetical protein